MRLPRPVLLSIASLAVASFLGGCESYFGVNDGPVEGYEGPGYEYDDEGDWDRPTGQAGFEIIGVSPSTASVGEQIEIYTASPEGTSTDMFSNEDFWYCFFDGQSAMVETGGDDYDPDVPISSVVDNPDVDVDITESDLEGLTVSVTTVTVPAGSVSGEALIFTPSGDEYFELTVR